MSEKILLVDDDLHNLNTLSRFLRTEGYEVAEASSGSEAVRLLERDHFDLIISDVIMPGVNGLQVVDSVRSLAPNTRVLFMTGFPSVNRTGLVNQQAADLIMKPFDVYELLSKVKLALER
jgi:two-component system cell cycle response regulator CpdR